MPDIWELGRYVEEHPDEHEQRWRLAKKLYLACEYRLALEHLQVLRNEWVRKQNVIRYLAAAYYRLGRYDEAVAELEEALEEWPDETGLREQLARVLETAGRSEEAARVWDGVARLDPGHAMASRSAERLRRRPGEAAPEEELHLHESDSGIDLAPKQVCPACGAQNSAEFDRCWQCHTALGDDDDALAEIPASPRAFTADRGLRRPLEVVTGALAVLLVAVGAYTAFSALPAGVGASGLPTSVYSAMLDELLLFRLVLGGVLLLTWPLALTLALRFVPSDAPDGGIVALAGAMLAVLAFGIAWAPFHTLPELAGLLAVVALCAIGALFGISLRDTVVVWLVQLVLVGAVAATVLAVVESPRALIELPGVIRYAGIHDAAAPISIDHAAPAAQVPARLQIRWESTGSAWLDGKLASVALSVDTPVTDPPLWFNFQEEGHSRAYGDLSTVPQHIAREVVPGVSYTFSVSGQPEFHGLPVSLVVRSLLRPVFGQST